MLSSIQQSLMVFRDIIIMLSTIRSSYLIDYLGHDKFIIEYIMKQIDRLNRLKYHSNTRIYSSLYIHDDVDVLSRKLSSRDGRYMYIGKYLDIRDY